MPTLHYRLVDVFTDRPFAGSPLAVVLDADDLDPSDLAKIARQLNIAVTAFPTQPDDSGRAAGAAYRLRVFGPGGEITVDGHPAVGTAWVLASLGRIPAGTVRQSLDTGPATLLVAAGGGPVELTAALPAVGPPVDAVAAFGAVSLPPGTSLAGPPPMLVGGFGCLLLADDRDVVRAGPDFAALHALGAPVAVFGWDAQARTAICRVFSQLGWSEEPATGSAALAIGVYLVVAGLLEADGESRYTVRQGAETGRPSRLECAVVARSGAVVECRVGGAVAAVASGEIRRPPAHR